MHPPAAAFPSSIGYPGNAQSSFNQLRLGAEAAIASGDWSSARELLCQAALMRPLHRGVAPPLLGRASRQPSATAASLC